METTGHVITTLDVLENSFLRSVINHSGGVRKEQKDTCLMVEETVWKKKKITVVSQKYKSRKTKKKAKSWQGEGDGREDQKWVELSWVEKTCEDEEDDKHFVFGFLSREKSQIMALFRTMPTYLKVVWFFSRQHLARQWSERRTRTGTSAATRTVHLHTSLTPLTSKASTRKFICVAGKTMSWHLKCYLRFHRAISEMFFLQRDISEKDPRRVRP